MNEKMTCDNAFMKFWDSNAGKRLHNKFCESNNHPELKEEMEEVDTTLKENPTGQVCKFKLTSCSACVLIFFNYSLPCNLQLSKCYDTISTIDLALKLPHFIKYQSITLPDSQSHELPMFINKKCRC